MLIFPQHQIVERIDKNQPNHAKEAARERKTVRYEKSETLRQTQTERNEGGSAQEDNREDTKTESDRWEKKYLLTNGGYVLE